MLFGTRNDRAKGSSEAGMAFPESHKKTDFEGVDEDMGLGVKTVAVLLSLN